MKNVESVWCILLIPVLVARRIISYPDEFFLSIWAYMDSLCRGPFEAFLLGRRGTDEKRGKGFLSRTVIMQLVFECSYHTNVDRLHFQSCVPGFFLSVQYNSFLFTFFSCLPSTKWLSSVRITVEVSCTCCFWRQTSVFGCKVMDNMENKTVLL